MKEVNVGRRTLNVERRGGTRQKKLEKIPPVAVITADRADQALPFCRRDVRSATFRFQLSTFSFYLSVPGPTVDGDVHAP